MPQAEASIAARVEAGPGLPDELTAALARHAARPAVVDGDTVTTYAELREIARRVSAHLAAAPGPPGQVIGVMAPADAASIGAVLGILCSGRAYLPLDPALPAAHLDRITRDAEVGLVLTRDTIAACEDTTIVTPAPAVTLARPAAVIYTSATTGTPKGVIQSGRCVLFHALTYAHHMALGAGDQVSLCPPLHAGASVSNLLGTLLAGGTLHPLPLARLQVDGILEACARHAITVLHMVPSLFRRLAVDPRAPAAWRAVHHLKLGGETVTSRDVQLFRGLHLPRARLVNGLGITEAGGNVTFCEIPPGLPVHGLVPVGRLVEGVSATILADDGGDGDAGELVVRGRFLASGYAGDRPAPFTGHDDGTTSLRTGDLVKRGPDGAWLHLGRRDQVVKINGVGVSLPEVEAALRSVTGVDDAAVVVAPDPDQQPRLCAALVGPHPLHASTVRRQLAVMLAPSTMPSMLCQIEAIPCAASGKTDRRALMDRVLTTPPLRDAPPRPPSNVLEARLLNLFRQALATSHLGMDDALFEAGGDSLRAADLLTLVQRDLGAQVTAEQLYRHPSAAALAALLQAGDWRDADSPAVLLRPGHPSNRLFLVPGAGSDVVALWDLAQALPPDLTVVGFQYPGLDGRRACLTSVPEIAAAFLGPLRQHQRSGPYRLAGTSFGGMVAFEMARQLEAAGEAVSFLGLLDTYAPGYLTFRRRLPLRARLRAVQYWCLPIGAKDVRTRANLASGLREKALLLKSRLLNGLPLPWLHPPAHRFYRLMAACFHAGRRYQIQPTRVPITLFLAEQHVPEDLIAVDGCLGWGAASLGGVSTIPIPGRHGHHIRPPHVARLGAILAEAMRARGAGPNAGGIAPVVDVAS